MSNCRNISKILMADLDTINPLAEQLHELIRNNPDNAQTLLVTLSQERRKRVVTQLVDGNSALYGAFLVDAHDLMVYMIETCNADVDQMVDIAMTGELFVKTTTLIQAAYHDELESAKILITHGASVNKHGERDSTPLYVACQLGHLDMVKYLVDSGADVNSRTFEGCSPTMVSCYGNHMSIVKYLVDNGADVDIGSHIDVTPVMVASENNYRQLVVYLVDKGADIHRQDDQGMNCLGCSVLRTPDPTLTAYLLTKGADINLRDNQGNTVIMHAVYFKCEDTVRMLLLNGCDSHINSPNNNGDTPLHYAMRRGCSRDIVKLLISHGANPQIKNNGQHTPCDMMPGGITGWQNMN